jgi:hypothetical protein
MRSRSIAQQEKVESQSVVRTRAEAPLGERSTTWATPFQSLITSSPDLGSMELTKRPVLIDGQPSSKQRARDAGED